MRNQSVFGLDTLPAHPKSRAPNPDSVPQTVQDNHAKSGAPDRIWPEAQPETLWMHCPYCTRVTTRLSKMFDTNTRSQILVFVIQSFDTQVQNFPCVYCQLVKKVRSGFGSGAIIPDPDPTLPRSSGIYLMQIHNIGGLITKSDLTSMWSHFL